MTTPNGAAAAERAADWVRGRLGAGEPSVAIVLGSGLGRLADDLADAVRIPYADIPMFAASTVPGHVGTLIAGTIDRVPVVAFAGRAHVYERGDAAHAAFVVRVAHALGARSLIVTNAAGGIRPTLRAGDLMLIRDHLNLMFRNPLIGPVQDGDLRFPDMSSPYDIILSDIAGAVARQAGFEIQDGVYAAVAGPSYETPAEIRMLALLGADAVGMSTVPEVIVARALGMRVLGLSCITNDAPGAATQPITHAAVLETTAAASAKLVRLVNGIVARIG